MTTSAGSPDPTETPVGGDAAAGAATVLAVHREDGPEAAVLVFSGELDITTLPQAERAVAGVEEAGPPVLLLDLSALEFVDSSGVRLVLVADQRAREAGRRLAVRLGGGLARRVFDVLGLVDRLDLVEDPGDLTAPP